MMKHYLVSAIGLVCSFLLASCGSGTTDNAPPPRAERPALDDAQLKLWFLAEPQDREAVGLPFDAYRDLTRVEAEVLQERAWNAWREAAIAKGWKADVEARRVRHGEYTMPYTLKTRGEIGPEGWPLTVTMHGGGTAPKAVNDRDWKHHQSRYDPEGKFVALRAPRDNHIWHPYIYPMLQKLYAQLILFEDVDPNRIMITGFSEGGYSVYRQFADMPDSYAAMAASGAGGILEKCWPENLFNTAVILQVGEHDNGFKRQEFARRYAAALDEYAGQHPGAFPHKFILHKAKGHGIDDRASIPWMAQQKRVPNPARVWWKVGPWHQPTERFWLSLDDPQADQFVKAEIQGNEVRVESEDVKAATVFLNDDTIDLDQPVKGLFNGQTLGAGTLSRTLLNLMESIARTGDPERAYSARLVLEASQAAGS